MVLLWSEKKSIEYSFGKTGYNKLLFDKSLCKEFDNASYSMKCILSEALHGGSAANLAEIEKNERNVCCFILWSSHSYVWWKSWLPNQGIPTMDEAI